MQCIDHKRRAGTLGSSSVCGRLLFLGMLLVALAGCGDEDPTRDRPPPPPPCGRLLVLTSDFQTGSISVVDADSAFTARLDVASTHSDAVARIHDGLLYVVNRFGGDNIQVIDPLDGYRTVRQFTTGEGSNPHDIAVAAPDRAYVSRNGSSSLLIVDPRNGEERGEISLAAFADGDGNPDMDRLLYLDPYLYVAIQRIDFGGATYKPVPPSYIAVVDTRADTLVDVDPSAEGVQAILLQGLNPSAPMVTDPSGLAIYVPETGEYGVLDGGIEIVDRLTWRSTGFLTREEQLGGDLIDFAIPEAGPGYATISDASYKTSLVSFDRATGAMIAPVHQSAGFELADLVVAPCGQLFVCDRAYAAPGLRVFDASTGLPVAGIAQPVPTGLPPFEIHLMGE